jgi:hypothetical protein
VGDCYCGARNCGVCHVYRAGRTADGLRAVLGATDVAVDASTSANSGPSTCPNSDAAACANSDGAVQHGRFGAHSEHGRGPRVRANFG